MVNKQTKKPTTANGSSNRKVAKNGSNGNSMRSVAISYPQTNSRPTNNRLTTMSGSDFISKVEVKSNVSGVGKIIKTLPISPSAYPGTRLTQFSQLYEFYRFVSLRLRWVPAVPTTLACQFVLYVDLDPTDDPTTITDEDSLVRQAVAQTGAQQWNFHVPKVINMAMRQDRQLFFTGADRQNLRFTQQGKAFLIQVTNPINFNGEPTTFDFEAGSLFLDWTVSFAVPQLNPSAQVLVNQVVTGYPVLPLADLSTGTDVRIVGLQPREYYVANIVLPQSDFGQSTYVFELQSQTGAPGPTTEQARIYVDTTSVRRYSVSVIPGDQPLSSIVFQTDDDGASPFWTVANNSDNWPNDLFFVIRGLFRSNSVAAFSPTVCKREVVQPWRVGTGAGAWSVSKEDDLLKLPQKEEL